jgi:hypothetical protein
MAEPGSSHSNPPSRAGTARARGAIFHRPPLRQRRPARRGSYCQTREADPCVDRLRATPARATQHRELHAATEDRGTLGLRALLLLHQRAAVLPGVAPTLAADEKQACRRRRQTDARVRERGTLARSDDCAVAEAVVCSGPCGSTNAIVATCPVSVRCRDLEVDTECSCRGQRGCRRGGRGGFGAQTIRL